VACGPRRRSGAAVLADGFSCRTRIEAGTDAFPLHLAELLDALPT
jgi:hypothetical protein